VETKEKAICEKAVQLWGQAIDEGYDETEDDSGITIDIFKGAHYAIGALKGFWTPSEAGFSVINQAISDLEHLLNFGDHTSPKTSRIASCYCTTDTLCQSCEYETSPERSSSPAIEESPYSRVRWRITREGNADEGYTYLTVGVNGYTVQRYFEETQPGELIEYEGKQVLPDEIPFDASFDDDNISGALSIWIDEHFSFELVREPSEPFGAHFVLSEDKSEVLIWDLDGLTVWATFDLHRYELYDCINAVLSAFHNFRVIFLESAA
jgi:hypothetical protein